MNNYRQVERGYHVNKRHWISISAGTAITRELVVDLIRYSYDLVVATLPQIAAQPI